MICESCNGYGFRGTKICLDCGGWGYNYEDEEEYAIKTDEAMQPARLPAYRKSTGAMPTRMHHTKEAGRKPGTQHSQGIRQQMAKEKGGSAQGGTTLQALPGTRTNRASNRGRPHHAQGTRRN